MNNILESLIDQYGLRTVIIGLSEIAFDKAEHLDVNWQDHDAARLWERAGMLLDGMSANPCIADLD